MDNFSKMDRNLKLNNAEIVSFPMSKMKHRSNFVDTSINEIVITN